MIVQLLSAFARTRSVPSKGFKVLTGKERSKLYKGKRAMKTGVHDRFGRFQVLACMLPQYVVPDLTNFALKPYVAHSVSEDPQAGSKQGPSGAQQ